MSNTDIENIPVISRCTVWLGIDMMVAYPLKTGRYTLLQSDMWVFRIDTDFCDQSGFDQS